jgi:hypothetical protein
MPPGTGLNIQANESQRLELLVRRTLGSLMRFHAPDVFGVLLNLRHELRARCNSVVRGAAQRQNLYAEARTSSVSLMRVGSILTPGPIVEDTVILIR